jgi:hypothetical protein
MPRDLSTLGLLPTIIETRSVAQAVAQSLLSLSFVTYDVASCMPDASHPSVHGSGLPEYSVSTLDRKELASQILASLIKGLSQTWAPLAGC